MAIAIFPRRWSEKPALGTQIDWGHPLAQALIGCWLFQERRGDRFENIASGNGHGCLYETGGGSAAVAQDNHGTAVSTSADGSYYNANSWTALNIANEITVCAIARPSSVAAGYNCIATRSTEWYLGRLGDAIVWGIGTGGAWTWISGYTTGTLAAGGDYHLAGMHTAKDTTAESYRDGHVIDTTTGRTMGANSSSVLAVLENPGQSQAWDGTVSGLWIYARALDRGMIEWHAAEPYAMMIPPAPRRHYVDIAASAFPRRGDFFSANF